MVHPKDKPAWTGWSSFFHKSAGKQVCSPLGFSTEISVISVDGKPISVFFNSEILGTPKVQHIHLFQDTPFQFPPELAGLCKRSSHFQKKKKKKGKTLKYGNMVFSLYLCYRKHQETRYLLTPQLVWAGQEYGFSETYWVSALADTLSWESPLSIGTNISSTAAMIGNKQ